MNRRLAVAFAAATLPLSAFATARAAHPDPAAEPPTLVVVIVVDQMRGDYLDRFGAQLTGGLGRLMRGGAVFTRAYQDHGVTETAPGHSTILSGRHPASTGLVRNDAGVQDSTAPLLGVRGPGASPARLRGTTLLDWVRASEPGVRALAVSRKDRGAILLAGRTHDASVFWYEAGRFTTSRWYADSLPAWVAAFNREMPAAYAPGRTWNLLLDSPQYTEPESLPYANNGRDLTFPHRLPDDTAAALRAFPRFPWIDSLTLALALDGVERLALGRRRSADLLAISLSQTDAIGHAWGPDSRELHDQILRVDRWLGTFLDSLGRLHDPRRMVVVLTADHGVASFPEWLQAHGHPDAEYVSVDTVLARYRTELRERAGEGAWIPFREYGLVPLDRAGLSARGVNVDSVADALRADLLRLPGVVRVDTRSTLAGADTTDDITRRWLHMLVPDGPGEVFVTLRPFMVFAPGRGNARHGQLSEEAAHVTLVLWGAGIRAGRYTQRVSTVDIAPTLAAVLGVQPTERVQGRVLREALR